LDKVAVNTGWQNNNAIPAIKGQLDDAIQSLTDAFAVNFQIIKR
jgi:hypothetical protein